MNFFWRKNYSHIHCNFVFITFLNDLPHSMHVTSYGVSSLFSNVFNILHMLQHKMFLEFLNAIPHSMHVTAMMFCKIPSQEQPFLAFFTWCLLSFFVLNSSWIVPIIFNSPAIRAKDLLLVQTCFSIGKIIFCSLLIYLTLSTWTASWSLVRWPLRFASSSHSLQVLYFTFWWNHNTWKH